MINKINPNGIIIMKKGGFYYNVSGNDALILNKYLGYKLFGVNKQRTGFPVAAQATVIAKIDTLGMDYQLLDQNGNTIISKKFKSNCYEIIDPAYPIEGIESDCEEPRKISKATKKPLKEKLNSYIEILQGLSEGVNVLTGEAIENLDEELKMHLFEMSLYFDEKLKSKERVEGKYPQHGKKWTKEEDDKLLDGYNQGATIKELSAIHQRGEGSIRSRLIKLGIII